jgi:uncharacterized protein
LIFRGQDVDIRLVEAGAMLHDIGRSRSHDVDHVVKGVEIAHELGLPENIVHIIERHVGAGIPDDEAKKLGFPIGHYIPETIEEKIVAYADKLIDGRCEKDIDVTIKHFEEKLGKGHLSIQRLKNLDMEIKKLLSG